MKLNQILALAALVAGGLFASNHALKAQDTPATPPAGTQTNPGQHSHPDFIKDLNLTDDQKPKFKAIMKGVMEKGKALREDTSLSMEDKKAKMKAIHDDTVAQMKALLTEEQFAKWQKMMPGPRSHHGEKPAAPPQ